MSDEFSGSDAPRERTTYSSFSDGYSGFDARDEEGAGRSLLVVGLAIGVVLVFGTVVWQAYRAGVKKDIHDTPVIRADGSEFKKKPDEQGGFTTPNQDKRLFDAMEPSEPAVPATTTNTSVKSSVVSDGEPTDIRPKGVVIAPPPPVSKSTPKPVPTTAPVPAPVTKTNNYDPTLVPSARFDQTGVYLVQIAALRDVPAAQKIWSQMLEAYPDMFAGAEMDIQRADLGAKGVFYRVRVSAFANREDADTFCDTLKARGESCIVATRN